MFDYFQPKVQLEKPTNTSTQVEEEKIELLKIEQKKDKTKHSKAKQSRNTVWRRENTCNRVLILTFLPKFKAEPKFCLFTLATPPFQKLTSNLATTWVEIIHQCWPTWNYSCLVSLRVDALIYSKQPNILSIINIVCA